LLVIAKGEEKFETELRILNNKVPVEIKGIVL
jgi:hypothetical protein